MTGGPVCSHGARSARRIHGHHHPTAARHDANPIGYGLGLLHGRPPNHADKVKPTHPGESEAGFSVDYPFESTGQATEFMRTAPLAPADKERVAHANAERILRLRP